MVIRGWERICDWAVPTFFPKHHEKKVDRNPTNRFQSVPIDRDPQERFQLDFDQLFFSWGFGKKDGTPSHKVKEHDAHDSELLFTVQ